MSRILVIAAYDGPRRSHALTGQPLLDEWDKALNKHKHSIDKVVIRRSVSGSYRAWWDAWLEYGETYDHYFFFEDDWVPCTDNWDDKFLEYMKPGVGYVGTLWWEDKDSPHGKHMAASCGAMSSKCLSKCDFKERDLFVYYAQVQVGWSRMVAEAGFKQVGIEDKYRIPFWGGGGIVYYGNPHGEVLLASTQYVLP